MRSYEPFSKWRMGATTPLKVPTCNTLPTTIGPWCYGLGPSDHPIHGPHMWEWPACGRIMWHRWTRGGTPPNYLYILDGNHTVRCTVHQKLLQGTYLKLEPALTGKASAWLMFLLQNTTHIASFVATTQTPAWSLSQVQQYHDCSLSTRLALFAPCTLPAPLTNARGASAVWTQRSSQELEYTSPKIQDRQPSRGRSS
jgi:hypothetical protein